MPHKDMAIKSQNFMNKGYKYDKSLKNVLYYIAGVKVTKYFLTIKAFR